MSVWSQPFVVCGCLASAVTPFPGGDGGTCVLASLSLRRVAGVMRWAGVVNQLSPSQAAEGVFSCGAERSYVVLTSILRAHPITEHHNCVNCFIPSCARPWPSKSRCARKSTLRGGRSRGVPRRLTAADVLQSGHLERGDVGPRRAPSVVLKIDRPNRVPLASAA